MTAAELAADQSFQRAVERLHDLGSRVTLELLAEIAAEQHLEAEVAAKVRRYSDLSPAALAVTGSDKMPPRALHGVAR